MNLLYTITIKLRGLIMLKKILVLSVFFLSSWNCENPLQDDSRKGKTNGIDNEQFVFYTLFFIVPDLDFNQFCPPTDQIPILEPGTHTKFMQTGDTYIFDNRARLNVATSFTEFFTFTIQENPGQEIKLTSPVCGNNSFEFNAQNDSGLPGQLETVYIDLRTPPLPKRRSFFFTKLTAVSGSGTVTFTTPNVQDPPH